MLKNPLNGSSSNNPFAHLGLDACKETIRLASKESLPQIVLQLSDDQYEYAQTTLPRKKAKDLEDAWNLAKVNALKA